jgi:hypothetical protein
MYLFGGHLGDPLGEMYVVDTRRPPGQGHSSLARSCVAGCSRFVLHTAKKPPVWEKLPQYPQHPGPADAVCAAQACGPMPAAPRTKHAGAGPALQLRYGRPGRAAGEGRLEALWCAGLSRPLVDPVWREEHRAMGVQPTRPGPRRLVVLAASGPSEALGRSV